MTHDLRHASFFSGVGGLDLGFDRAGFRTVSFSEVDPYASAVLARQWPDVPNLGDIVALAARGSDSIPDADLWTGGFPCTDLSVAGKRKGFGLDHDVRHSRERERRRGGRPVADAESQPGGSDERPADDRLRPVQPASDGQRIGLAESGSGRGEPGDGAADWRDGIRPGADEPTGLSESADDFFGGTGPTRSGLAFAFLGLLRDALGRGRAPRCVILENVPGLLSSHGGRDMAALLSAMVDLGYGVAYRVLDAQHVRVRGGRPVPQRRRRVFIVGLRIDVATDPDGRAAAERAAAVLSVGSRCRRHPPTGVEAGPGPAERPADSALSIGSLTARGLDKHATQNAQAGHYVSATLDTSDGREGRDQPTRLVQASGPSGERAAEPGHEGPAVGRDEPRGLPGALRASGAGYPVSANDEGRLVVSRSVNTARGRYDPDTTTHVIERQTADAPRDGAPDGMAGRLDDSPRLAHAGLELVGGDEQSHHQRDRVYADVAPSLDAHAKGPGDSPIIHYRKSTRAASVDHDETWVEADVTNTLNAFDVGDARAADVVTGSEPSDDDYLPLGLDGHRYRCCGNGVVATVAEWLALRLAAEAAS